MKKYFEIPKMELMEIEDIIVTSINGGNGNHITGVHDGGDDQDETD